MPQIWVDADACPKVIKEILFRAAPRTKTMVTFVANSFLTLPNSPYIRLQQVAKGFDIADNTIIEKLSPSDLVITSDIPLADEALTKNAVVLTPRGASLTKENIKEKLMMRDFMDTLRASGIHTNGPDSMNTQDRQLFAKELDQWLQKYTS
ncbi:YaiI/YqxD family protein [Neisseria sp. Ec49-e6-T10]|uniref:YaiI/YqxD family protein n=1 Tax=Neisseria sp. Ec49-e6-T10 TaxID=3140744 RepID=UPI003EB93170